MLSEEEIKNIRGILSYNISPEQKVNLLKLLDLYNNEKEKNEKLEEQRNIYYYELKHLEAKIINRINELKQDMVLPEVRKELQELLEEE